MYRDDLDRSAVIRDLKRRIRVLETQAPVGFTAVSRGALRIISPEGLIVDGSARVGGRLDGSGTFDWTGPMWLRGSIMLPGNLTGVGTLLWSGPWELRGNGDITGDVGIDGDLSLGSGRFLAGPLIIDKAGGYGARVYSTGTLLLDASGNVVLGSDAQVLGTLHSVGNFSTNANISALGDITAVGDVGGGSKSFWIDHPTKDGRQLRHGSLEGPEHGVFYRGVAEFDDAGEAVFELPEYFTALVLPDDVPTVHVTAIGRPFLTGAELVDDGKVTIYGEPGREAHVTVTAARELFDVEPVKAQ